MKIGILCYPTYGGSGIVATELGMSLAQKGYEIHFISSNLPARLDMTNPNIFFHKVNVETYPLFKYQPYDIALSSAIYQVVKLYKLDLIHVHYAIPYAYAAFVAKQMLKDEGILIPMVTTLHGTDITLVGQYPSYKAAVQFSINHSDTVTSVSESLKKDTLKAFTIKKEIQVIPNFIDNDLYNSFVGCCRRLFAEDDEKLLIHVSNLRKVKRIPDVLEVFKRVQEKVLSKLVIIGEGPDMELINDFLMAYPYLIDKIRILGKTNDLYQILKCTDVFLLPSEQESFGLAALEAMAAGNAVISSNAGGIPEVNIQGETGFLTEVGDVETMAKKTINLLQDDALLQKMKEKAKEVALRFDLKNILPQYEQMYRETIESFKN
ncbi:N-acetyl-alpha-D-glucosaminyl L-malate synthase BshA [Riemerella anatipestifer]|uniref:Glycosyl transferase group 1 n=1 Tax=Riemerella anatipestifer (strain ATCC 11845 / DSM 15868 / JCM 9532 / NCTC 11014) TaxID=693978 RepID=E4TCV5_RIEAD|nr:N-acetyl-alpha-D-glucosaminyl L-malate synthase BshA [Riemerella anatipestifer]ADQ82614.1 glycosyl transferase group 1 [Riemerella anatipestifer ATCC 11845 = DSM 15868]AFD56624.1 glycosyl transferase group 1 [Riemerella anatipestifer ATCC 11845 = DSM 15868]AGC39400.1 Glycosyltransferase [Riemerella anatipestifer RA-CH-2]AKP69803.1 Glycosyltransferase [Riemerella anatipestifer]AKP71758.1 Glycosyltransferase [Riemerella anatipestifer]